MALREAAMAWRRRWGRQRCDVEGGGTEGGGDGAVLALREATMVQREAVGNRTA
jgi:hypothetical protein